MLPICLVDGLSALLAQTAWWCHRSSFLQSVVGLSRLPDPQIWNNLPEDVTSAPSLSTFRQRLKTYLFRLSFPHLVLQFLYCSNSSVDVAVMFYLGHSKKLLIELNGIVNQFSPIACLLRPPRTSELQSCDGYARQSVTNVIKRVMVQYDRIYHAI